MLRLQKHLHDRFAVICRRLDMLDIVDQRGESLLVGRGQAPFEFFRIEAGICPADRNDRNIDVGKDIGGRAQDDHRRAMRINSARTINVYGRLRATLTIHIQFPRAPCGRDCGVTGLHRRCGTIALAYAGISTIRAKSVSPLESLATKGKLVRLSRLLSSGRHRLTGSWTVLTTFRSGCP